MRFTSAYESNAALTFILLLNVVALHHVNTFSLLEHRAKPTPFSIMTSPYMTTCGGTILPPMITMSSAVVARRRKLSFCLAAVNPSSDVEVSKQNVSSQWVSENEQTLPASSSPTLNSEMDEKSLTSPSSLKSQSPQQAPAEDGSTGSSGNAVLIVTTTASTLLLAALVGLVAASGPGGWRYYVAGGLCAAISHGIATPIDVVKVRTMCPSRLFQKVKVSIWIDTHFFETWFLHSPQLPFASLWQTRKQVDPDLLHTSFAKATRRIIETEGINTLLSGFGPTTFGYLLEGSLKFGIYEILKPAALLGLKTLAQLSSCSWLQSQFLSFVVCGGISGAIASLILCPLEAIRIRMVAEPEFCTGNWIEGGYKMVKSEGISALSKGLTPMLYKQVPYTIAKNVAFDVLTHTTYDFLRTAGIALTGTIKVLIPLVCALVTSVLATIFSQPGDTLLSLVNAHEGSKRTNDFIRDILQQGDGGVKGFFVGTKSRFLHVGIIVTSQLILYDFLKRLVGIAPTGSVWAFANLQILPLVWNGLNRVTFQIHILTLIA